MQVFKFGGASVKDAQSVKNVAKILELYQTEQLLVVLSAMGKTTNALEKLADAYYHQKDDTNTLFEEIKQYHYTIVEELLGKNKQQLADEIANTFVEIEWILEEEPHTDFAFVYDQIVAMGELLSTRIVSGYLTSLGVKNTWIDARSYIHTDNTYREGKIDWPKTDAAISGALPQLVKKQLVITQGFIGSTSENYITTLGREGSDYSAAIFASCLHAQSVTIWKDVPGVLNADPKLFSETHKFEQLPYSEAIEMTYYGATVIHPKTIKPLQNKNIPLHVRPFLSPLEKGTTVGEVNQATYSHPTIIVKQQQVLISISTRDFSFITEDKLSRILAAVANHQVKINVMQNSALSFSICVDEDSSKVTKLITALQEEFKVKYNEGLQLFTLRHATDAHITQFLAGKDILIEQRSRNTLQVVVKQSREII